MSTTIIQYFNIYASFDICVMHNIFILIKKTYAKYNGFKIFKHLISRYNINFICEIVTF